MLSTAKECWSCSCWMIVATSCSSDVLQYCEFDRQKKVCNRLYFQLIIPVCLSYFVSLKQSFKKVVCKKALFIITILARCVLASSSCSWIEQNLRKQQRGSLPTTFRYCLESLEMRLPLNSNGQLSHSLYACSPSPAN